MADGHPNHRLMTNKTVRIVADVLCCLRRNKQGLQFPLNTSAAAAAQNVVETVSERTLWAKRNRMGTSLVTQQF
jgi:hypothetical protein